MRLGRKKRKKAKKVESIERFFSFLFVSFGEKKRGNLRLLALASERMLAASATGLTRLLAQRMVRDTRV